MYIQQLINKYMLDAQIIYSALSMCMLAGSKSWSDAYVCLIIFLR